MHQYTYIFNVKIYNVNLKIFDIFLSLILITSLVLSPSLIIGDLLKKHVLDINRQMEPIPSADQQLFWIQSFPSPKLNAIPRLKNSVCSNILPIAGERIIEFLPFPVVLILCEMQRTLLRIWTRVGEYISYNNVYLHKLNIPYSRTLVCRPSLNSKAA